MSTDIIKDGTVTRFWYYGAAQAAADELIETQDYDFLIVEDGKDQFVRRKNPQDFLAHINSIYGDDHPKTCSCAKCEKKRKDEANLS